MLGLRPRKYDSTDDEDRLLAEENTVMDEMLFQLDGLVGIGFTRIGKFDKD